MNTISIRRLSDATLAKYQRIIDAGGELTPRQKRALEGHMLIADRVLVTALLQSNKNCEVSDETEAID